MTRTSFPPGFAEGLRRFAAGEYFEAHEAFEDCLDAVDDERWDLLVALIQVAVGYHKLASGHPGATRMLGLGHEKLVDLPYVAWGIDVRAIRQRVERDRDRPDADVLRDDPPRIALGG